MVGIAITNAGPGPAGIKAITFYVDRKPVADADDMGRTYAKLSAAELGYQIMEPGDTLMTLGTALKANERRGVLLHVLVN
jgi:hypothetical protein